MLATVPLMSQYCMICCSAAVGSISTSPRCLSPPSRSDLAGQITEHSQRVALVVRTSQGNSIQDGVGEARNEKCSLST